MKLFTKILCILPIVFAAPLALAQGSADASPIPKVSDEWRFEVTPYLWGTGIRGTVNLNDSAAKSADMSSSNVLSDLKSGGMIAAEAHNGKWGIMGDLVSATLAKFRIGPSANARWSRFDWRQSNGSANHLNGRFFVYACQYKRCLR
jgi:hypothetical protein